MGKYIPVEPEKWAAMVKAQSDLPRWKEMCDELEARCNSLKAEVERLRKEVETQYRESMSDEYDLNNQSRIINGLLRDKEQMQGKIDRLTNAGDLLVFHYTSLGRKFFPDDPLPNSITNWNAAKESKQP